MRSLIVLSALWLGALCSSGALFGAHPLPGPHFVQCEARGPDIVVSWDALGISPNLHTAKLFRDDALLSMLEPAATSYRDVGLAAGLHKYRLDVLAAEPPDEGRPIASRECEATVVFVDGILCSVFGGIGTPPRVLIVWSPPLPDLEVIRVDVRRDGDLVASLPEEATEFQEEPLSGEHLYSVAAVLIGVDPLGPAETAMVIGDCLAVYTPIRFGGFVRGDPNGDGGEDLSDAVFVLLYLFGGEAAPTCLSSADANDSGAVDLSDAIYVLGFLFLGDPAPPAPFPECGDDPTPDKLSCDTFARCFNPPPP